VTEELNAVTPDLPERPRHEGLTADFADSDALGALIERNLAAGGPIHILVNNTGGPPGGPIAKATADQFLEWFSKHLVCNHILARACRPGMEQAGYGRIINIVSTSVKQPIEGLGVSNTVRGAVASWAKTLSTELAASGITVNNVLPGATQTDRLTSLIASKAKASGVSDDEVADQMRGKIPARRFAQPEEIAAAALFLAGPGAAYITGVSLPVDGGRTNCL
jgi:3-oxoacyl-[acyl-carrier protein] reductase